MGAWLVMDAISVICLDFKNSFDSADLIIIICLDLKTYLSIHHENRTVLIQRIQTVLIQKDHS